ncbi:MAG: hypothetical protein HY813_01525 [Candidatus Portnoybacteria bacterium]|nr:hypothetical protein [Candidatus Portnoybacteria bacterium]
MFERFFGGKQKEAVVTNEKMLANELRTPKGSYFNNLKTIVAALTLAGFILPLASIDKAVAGPPRETKQMSEVNPQTETGQRKMAELLQKIKNEKGLDITMAGGHFVGTQEQTKEIVQIEQYANIKDTAGANHYFGYVYWDEMLFISNNQDCLKKMTDAHSPEPGL